eukprot:TRINITY_DN37479_c0_g1_i1.p1 TRINITY_DN37479_c0_g1~~TRINITY_DN37479_c0_g1_i1.p1  ORF type:complete len:709 (-),score=113.41 TRINITY_DN37479_c0_g1_i1:79-2154(-)
MAAAAAQNHVAGALGPAAHSPPGLMPDQTQHSVEFLCGRFSTLFAQLHKEEVDYKAALARNEMLERKLAALRQREDHQVAAGRAEVDTRLREVAELRRGVDSEERRAAADGGEACTLAAAAAAYARQAERLRERCHEEQAREHAVAAASARREEELEALRRRCDTLNAEVVEAETAGARVSEALRTITSETTQTVRDISGLEQRVRDERRRYDNLEASGKMQWEEICELEQLLARSRNDREGFDRMISAIRVEARESESQLLLQIEKRAQNDNDLEALRAQLRNERRAGSESQAKVAERMRDVHRLRDRLQTETWLHRQETEVSDRHAVSLDLLRSELPAAERSLRDAELELSQLRAHGDELESTSLAKRRLRDELRQQHDASEAELRHLQSELQQLATGRVQLQQQVDEALLERTRLELEVEVAAPALQDAWRRCRSLEERLAARVRELEREEDRGRRCRAEADAARGRLNVLERQHDAVAIRLRELAQQQQPAVLSDLEQSSVPRNPPAQMPVPLSHSSSIIASPGPRSDRRVHFHPEKSLRSCTPDPSQPKLRQYVKDDQSRSQLNIGCAGLPSPSLGGPSASQAYLSASPRAADAPPHAASSSNAFDSVPAALASLYVPSTSGHEAHGSSSQQPRCVGDDAVRFLCEFVAREEERLGLTPLGSMAPSSSVSPSRLPPASLTQMPVGR